MSEYCLILLFFKHCNCISRLFYLFSTKHVVPVFSYNNHMALYQLLAFVSNGVFIHTVLIIFLFIV